MLSDENLAGESLLYGKSLPWKIRPHRMAEVRDWGWDGVWINSSGDITKASQFGYLGHKFPFLLKLTFFPSETQFIPESENQFFPVIFIIW